jgi:hypothetical protein
MDYIYWDLYLRQGKHKAKTTERPVGSGSTKRVYRLSNGDIGLKYHDTFCVVFHPDSDEITLNTGGFLTVSTKAFIREVGPTSVRIWSEKGQWYLPMANPTITDPKVQKCRRCHGNGTVPDDCYGPDWCYAAYGGSLCVHGERTSHRRETCSHGQTVGHALDPVTCWQCEGSGRCDYGSKRVHFAWSGSPYRFDPAKGAESGKYVDMSSATGMPYVPPVYKPYDPSSVPAPHGESYSDSGRILTELMPDIDKPVAYPCKGTTCHPRDVGESRSAVRSAIMVLNDTCKWTREQIADWIETLDLDLRFPSPVE